MTETAQPSADTAPLHPRQLLLPSLTAMVHDFGADAAPSSVVHALQAKQLLQQMAQAVQVVELASLGKLMQSMEAPLQAYASTGELPSDKAGELLQLAARDMQAFLQALNSGAAAHPQGACLPATAPSPNSAAKTAPTRQICGMHRGHSHHRSTGRCQRHPAQRRNPHCSLTSTCWRCCKPATPAFAPRCSN